VACSSVSEVLLGKYSEAESNIMKLKSLETTVLHGVDVKTMKFHTDLKNKRFDRIVFNFPHAGFRGREDQVHMIKYVHHIFMFILVFY
jgi:25S rRNA (uracil2634-N3)-methyltransferase